MTFLSQNNGCQASPDILMFKQKKGLNNSALCVQAHNTLYIRISYSFLIAANGLSFIALLAGKNPATMPTSIAKPMDRSASQKGM